MILYGFLALTYEWQATQFWVERGQLPFQVLYSKLKRFIFMLK